jgi:hypothetical protein
MSPSLHQYRLPPVTVPFSVAVDGSDPEALGGVWLPRTAVGEGDEPGGDGEAEAPGLLDEVGDADGGPDCAVAGDGVVAAVDGGTGVVAAGALCATFGDALAELGEKLAEELGETLAVA